MKVAVSIPDPLFEAADQVARRRKLSRSRLYAAALELLLDAEDDNDITARLDRVYGTKTTRDETSTRRRVIAVRESW
jgi:metal-responsive CopG/Arc/MetJ family transcriptional regulator